MFKLTVVGGPAKGTSYSVKDNGETSIGRIGGNDIVLASQKVSKRHCVLVVNNSDVTVKDAGSSNGTFVNGVLTKLKKLMPGDRVSVGEYVLELSSVEHRVRAHSANNVVPINSLGGFPAAQAPMGIPGMGNTGINLSAPPANAPGGSLPQAAAPPKDLKEKAKFYFETYVLNFLYNMNEKHEWRAMIGGLFGVMVFAAVVLSVYPVLQRTQEKLAEEAEDRAALLARQIVDRNAQFVFEKLDSKVDVSFVEKEPGVIAAYLIDTEGRVLAPGRKLNQYLTEPNEAAFSALARESFAKRDTLERRAKVYGNAIAVAVPLKVFSAASAKNVTVGIGLVFYDRARVLFDEGTEALAYIQALILAAIVGVVAFFSIYRLTLRPLLALNDDVDQVLKGNSSGVNRKYKMEEIEPLIDVVNAALQRANSSSGHSSGDLGLDQSAVDEMIAMVRFAFSKSSNSGAIAFSGDRKICHISPFLEDVTGIRNDSAVGSDINTVARDAAFVSFIEDILSKAPLVTGAMASDPVAEDFEFSGTPYKMECLAFGQPGIVKLFVLTAVK